MKCQHIMLWKRMVEKRVRFIAHLRRHLPSHKNIKTKSILHLFV